MSRLRKLTADQEALQADELIARARVAFAGGRRADARRCLWEALAADPESVKAWLMLASLAPPRASLGYVTRALELRPHDPIAHAALRWARERVGDAGQAVPAPPPGTSTPPTPLTVSTATRAGPGDSATLPQGSPGWQPDADVTLPDVVVALPVGPGDSSTVPDVAPAPPPEPDEFPTSPHAAVRPEAAAPRLPVGLVLLPVLVAAAVFAAAIFGGTTTSTTR